ncbi:MAG: ATP-grasp domain-containing protein [Sporichthyaceae bacterium]
MNGGGSGPIRVWFNRTFSSAYHAVNLIRHNPDGVPVEVYGSHDTPDAVFLGACDHTFTEPALPAPAYVEWALAFCAEHRIDVFVPKRHLETIAAHRFAFEAAGTRLFVAGSPGALRAVGDKGALYETLKRIAPEAAPRFRVVSTAAEFAAAYEEIAAGGTGVCFKPNRGEGGGGFRIVDPTASPLAALGDFPSSRVGLHATLDALASVESFAPLVVSELLPGAESSIDCLGADGELIAAVARRKLDRRTQRIERSPELVAVAEAIAAEYSLSAIFNVQFMVGRDGPKVIDVNPRMAAGVDVSAASGINLPWLGVQLAMTGTAEVPVARYGMTVGRIDHLVTVSGGGSAGAGTGWIQAVTRPA